MYGNFIEYLKMYLLAVIKIFNRFCGINKMRHTVVVQLIQKYHYLCFKTCNRINFLAASINGFVSSVSSTIATDGSSRQAAAGKGLKLS